MAALICSETAAREATPAALAALTTSAPALVRSSGVAAVFSFWKSSVTFSTDICALMVGRVRNILACQVG